MSPSQPSDLALLTTPCTEPTAWPGKPVPFLVLFSSQGFSPPEIRCMQHVLLCIACLPQHQYRHEGKLHVGADVFVPIAFSSVLSLRSRQCLEHSRCSVNVKWMGGWMTGERMDGWVDGWMDQWPGGWVGGWRGGWWMMHDGWVGEWPSSVCRLGNSASSGRKWETSSF